MILLLLLFSLLLSQIGANSIQLLKSSNIYSSEDVANCRSNLKELTTDDWEYYRKIQEIYTESKLPPMKKISMLENLIQERRALHESLAGRNMTLDAHRLFTVYTVTDSQRNQKARVDDLLSVVDLFPHRFEDKAIIAVGYMSLIENWDNAADVIEKSLGFEEKKMLIKSFRVLNESDDFHLASDEQQRKKVLGVLGCYMGASIRKAIYHEDVHEMKSR